MSNVRVPDPDVVVTHPNRDKAASKGTRAFVIVLQATSAVLVFFLAVVSWGIQLGAVGLQVLIGILFAYFTYAVINWRSGVLPIAAGTAIVSGVFAAVSVTSWFDRGDTGYDQPIIAQDLIGVVAFAFAVLQLVNVVVCLRGFSQNWQEELEVPRSSLQGGRSVAA
ncbi:MAG: hypothetical protein JHD16_01860 [Solirubrobacteraceae bacterium]|nr:hypothetical protein [Solirubrobacteraceae bacterium]